MMEFDDLEQETVMTSLRDPDVVDALTRRYLPADLRELIGMEDEKEYFDLHTNTKKIDVSKELPVVVSSHQCWANPDKFRERRVTLRAKISAFGLSPESLDRLKSVVGRHKYDERTGILKLVSDNQRTKEENKFFVKSMFKSILAEALKADPNYLPMEPQPPPENIADISFLRAFEKQKYNICHFPLLAWQNLK